MKFEEVKNLETKEIEKKLSELRGQLFEMKMKNSLGQLGNPVGIRLVRKDIARLNTALTSRAQA